MQNTQQLVQAFLNNGGKVTKCPPRKAAGHAALKQWAQTVKIKALSR